jgi:hypothetical protein
MPRIAAKESDVDDLKEILTLAARACGIEGPLGETFSGQPCIVVRGYHPWRPQLDAGDGAEMENKLRIGISWLHDCVVCFAQGKERAERYADHPDKGTARHWASLRVAAAIGRSMK